MAETRTTAPEHAAKPDPAARPEPVQGMTVDPDCFVVLASLLGRQAEQLPKLNPNDPLEQPKYHVPPAYQRGEIIMRDQIPAIPNGDNVERLLRNGAIGYRNHPDAEAAIAALAYVREAQARVAAGRS